MSKTDIIFMKFSLNKTFLIDFLTNDKLKIVGDINKEEVFLLNDKNCLFKGKLKLYGDYYYFKYGTLYNTDGTKKYDGYWYRGYYHGIGSEYSQNNNLQYSGGFKKGKYHGHGTLYDVKNCLMFEGNFYNGIKNGYGKFFKNNYLNFEGNYKNGVSHGFGIQYFRQSSQIFYKGDFKNNVRDGYGFQFCNCGSLRYNGHYKNNVRKGYGILFDCDNYRMYEGYFFNNSYNGKGKLFRNDILYIQGRFKKGHVFGYATEYDKYEKVIYKGYWKKTKYHGKGHIYTLGNKKLHTFKNGINLDLIKDMKIRQFIETGDKNKIDTVSTKYLQKYFGQNLERYLILEKLKENKTKEKNNINNNKEEREFDLFGNKIEFPCYGNDNGIYDLSSMRNLFKTDENGDFLNISYIYKNNKRVANFPVMNEGKQLTEWYCPSLDFKN
jgi:hypothetical protein